MVTAGKPVASLRWWIGGLLFASTVNYVSECFPKPERARPHFLIAVLRLPGGNIGVVRVAPLIPDLDVGWRWLYYPPEAHSRIGQA